MYRGSKPKIFPVIIIIIIVALIIAALVTAGRMLFSKSRTDKKDEQQTSETFQEALLNTDGSHTVRWTVRGPIVADENYKSYQIVVTPTSRVFTTYSGYLDKVIDIKSYSNNTDAYEQFVYALDKTSIGKTRDADQEDFRGVCATKGIAFKFDILKNDADDKSVWSSTCKESPGTMTADPLKVQALFVNQIPDFQPVFNKIY